MTYVDGFVLAIPSKNIDAYKRIAQKAAKVWIEHGALEYREAVGDDLAVPMGVPFPKMMKAKPGETIVFAWITYKSRAHRDKVNGKVMKYKRLTESMKDVEMPFDCKRMVWGGFKILVKQN